MLCGLIRSPHPALAKARSGIQPKLERKNLSRPPRLLWETVRRKGALWPIAITALLLIAAISAKGVPVLRHDWAWPLDRGDFIANGYYAFSGWFDFGYGEPNPYPNSFLTAPLFAALGIIFGPLITLQLLFLFIAGVLGTAVMLVGKRIGAPRLAIIAAIVFSCFNPWTYNEIVAGHIGMMLGYCSVLLFAGALCNGVSDLMLLLILALSFSQIQFFLPVGSAVALMAYRQSRYKVLIAYIALVIPLAVGIGGNLQALSSIPDLPEWRITQSVQPLSALRMSGYFANYAKAFDGTFPKILEYIFVVLSLCGVVAAPFRRRVRAMILFQACVALAMCSGVYAPWFAAALRFIAPPLPSVYREMYDLIPFLIVAYMIGGMAIAARYRATAILWSSSVLALGVLWFLIPVSTYWISGTQVHRIKPDIESGFRYAVLPAFQPLQWHHDGSGADPDVRPFINGTAALNEYVPQYPVGMALSRFSLLNDSSELAALGVQKIYIRSEFNTDPQSQFWDHAKHPVASAVVNVLDARPLFTVVDGPIPEPATTDTSMVDKATLSGVLRFTFGRDSLDPDLGWASLRFASTRFPGFDDSREGLLTKSRRPLRVHSGARYVLTSIDGKILALPGHKTIAASTRRYTWARLPNGTRAVMCDGVCSVLADARNKPIISKPHQLSSRYSADFVRIAPWLYEVYKPHLHGVVLCFNTRYESSWVAFRRYHRLTHLRLSPATNGWLISNVTSPIIIINWIAAIQATSSLFAAILVYTLLIRGLLWTARTVKGKNNGELPIAS